MSKALSKDIDVISVLSMRDDDGMTQKEIANRLGCCPATISRILKGYPRQKKVTIPCGPDPEMDDFFAQPIPPEPSVPAPPPEAEKDACNYPIHGSGNVPAVHRQSPQRMRRGMRSGRGAPVRAAPFRAAHAHSRTD